MASSTVVSRSKLYRWRWLVIGALVAGIALVFSSAWLPWAQALVARLTATAPENAPAAGAAEPRHAAEQVSTIEVSEQARKSMGLELMTVALKPFERAISVPGVLVERPGRSSINVTAPMTGVVMRIYPIQGEAVQPGQPLFDLRITHEDLVTTQTEYLRTIEELDVIGRELERLEKVASQGIAGKTLLERKYEQQKQEALLRAQRQALLLHGLSAEQVEDIRTKRQLLRSLTITAPAADHSNGEAPDLLQVQELKVETGQSAMVGATLAVLAHHAELHVEASAFAQDVEAINRVAANDWPVSATLESPEPNAETIPDLKILYLSGRVDTDSRIFHFYVTLRNKLLREGRSPDGRRFIYWRYKPGQRVHVQVPVERWQDQIVVPSSAVVQEGVEHYVFVPNGKQFDRRPVHVKHRDPAWVVLANDGSLFPGEILAKTGAHQLQLALKNQSGGGADPHAGHDH